MAIPVNDWHLQHKGLSFPILCCVLVYSEWFIADLWAESRCTGEFGFFSLVIMKSVTADGSPRSPTGGVEGLNPAPHIHEQMTSSNYV